MKDSYIDKNIIGSDETGVGDYLSPIVAAAVFVAKENILKLINFGVTDSKKISNKKIIEIFEKIKPYINYSIRFILQNEYNFLTENKKYNAHELKLIIHLKAINSLEERIKNIDLIIIDQFASLKNIHKYFEKISKKENVKMPKTEIITLINGELEHVSVAAASIVARAHFLKLMEEQNKKWKMKFPFGTNEIVELAAKDFIKKYSKEKLNEVAKLSFKTTKKII